MLCFARIWVLAALTLTVACGGRDGTTPRGDAGSGLSCGTTTCSAGQVCCIDCDGTGTCGTPGTLCSGGACLPDGGLSDGGTGVSCGTLTCAVGQVCCIDCDGSGTCGPPETPCPGVSCPGDDAGTTSCGDVACGSGESCMFCCGEDMPGICGGPGICATVDCPKPPFDAGTSLCPPGQCIVVPDGMCELPSGPTGNGCCACGDDGLCSERCMCAAPTTPVRTPAGDRPIADIALGDLVYSVHRGAVLAVPVIRVRRTPVVDHAVVRATLADGAVLEISPVHPTADGRRFSDLSPGDRLGDVELLSVELVPYEYEATFDVLPDSDTGTWFAGDALVGSTLR